MSRPETWTLELFTVDSESSDLKVQGLGNSEPEAV